MFTSLWSEFPYRLRALVHRDVVERELDDEVRFHLEHQAEQLMRAGVPRHEAMRRAQLAFGGVNRIKDDTRDARGTTFLEHVGQDLRYAIRSLRARPAFTAVVVATIGLGVGVNAAMFGVVERAGDVHADRRRRVCQRDSGDACRARRPQHRVAR